MINNIIHHTEEEDHTDDLGILGVHTTEDHTKEAEDSIDLYVQLERIPSNQLTPTDNNRITLFVITVGELIILLGTVRKTNKCLYDRTGWRHEYGKG